VPEPIRIFQITLAGCAMVMLAVAALLVRTPVAGSDRSNLVAAIGLLGIATAIIATPGPLPARIAGWTCAPLAITGVAAYLIGKPWATWAFVGAAMLAAATVLVLVANSPVDS
jgi:hypothetical protein